MDINIDWVRKICAEKNIQINDTIPVKEIKDNKLFCISSSIGDLYLKKTTSFINDEVNFTVKLMESGIIDQPELIGYDRDLKLLLMRDMGGSDLSELQSLDMETALSMFISLANIQKNSIEFVKSKDFCGFDYRIDTMLNEIVDLPEMAYKMLSDTQYMITLEETDKLKHNLEHVRTVLESLKELCLPDTIHHGDLGSYNVRIVDGKSIFYDWGCGGVSHPFFDMIRLLSSGGSKLPNDESAIHLIISEYIMEWFHYGHYQEMVKIFTSIRELLGFYMLYCKYIRAKNLHILYAENPNAVNTDAMGLDNRYSTTATYIKRFIL